MALFNHVEYHGRCTIMPVVGVGSLFSIIDFQSRGTAQILNKYWYFANVPPNTIPAAEIGTLFESILTAWLPTIQALNLDHDIIEITEETSLSNFISRPSSITSGTLTGVALPNFMAASIRLFRTTKETRSGWKRFIAGTEDELNVNVWTAGFLILINNLAGVLNDPLIAVGGNADPCIVRQTRDPITGDLLPVAQWIYNLVSSAAGESNVTTQNTRKLGRGI